MWVGPLVADSLLNRLSVTARCHRLVKETHRRSCLVNLSRTMMSTSDGCPHVYVTRRVPPRGVELLREVGCRVTQWESDDPVPRDELLRNVRGVDGLFCLLTDTIDKEVLDQAGPNLKVIGTMSVGYDHIDVKECHKRGVPIGYTPDVLTDATADLTIALLLATARRIPEGVEAVKSGAWGTWKPMWLCGQSLRDCTVGIVGLGRIGLAVAKRLQPFGVSRFLYTGNSAKPHAADVRAEFVAMETLLKDSDFVIVCCALNEKTKEMFNNDLFSQMKRTAVFINTSRGGVVKQDDLYNALKSGTIWAAGLDVTTPEPLPTDSPLLELNNCVVLPHIASADNNTRSLMAELTARNILAALDGKTMPAQIKP